MKTQAHIRYRNQEGKVVPGVTTILGLLNKPALVPWANRLGLEGIDVGKYVDDKAEIGTLAHAMCTDHLMGVGTDLSHYDAHQQAKATNCTVSFLAWLEKHDLTPILIEGQMAVNAFGGTIDIYGKIDGRLELIDLKTGSGIWEEYLYQVAAYKYLLQQHGFQVDAVRILNIPRADTESFLERSYTNHEVDLGFKIFMNCLSIYLFQKQLKK